MEQNNESRNRDINNRNTRGSDQYNNRNQDSDRSENRWDNNSPGRYGRNRSERRLDSMGSLGNDSNRFNDDDFGSRGSHGQSRTGSYEGSYESGNHDRGQLRNNDYGNRGGSYDDRERNRDGSSYYNRDSESRNWWDKTKDEVSGWFGDENAQQRRSTDQQNQHRGKGPKGYIRTDERIKEDVHERLTDDGMIDASEIEVDVKNGEIFLKGTVKNRQEKRRAEDIVEDISGVKNVENHIKVQQEGSTSSNSGQSSGQYGEKKFGTNAGSGLNVGSEYTIHN